MKRITHLHPVRKVVPEKMTKHRACTTFHEINEFMELEEEYQPYIFKGMSESHNNCGLYCMYFHSVEYDREDWLYLFTKRYSKVITCRKPIGTKMYFERIAEKNNHNYYAYEEN